MNEKRKRVRAAKRKSDSTCDTSEDEQNMLWVCWEANKEGLGLTGGEEGGSNRKKERRRALGRARRLMYYTREPTNHTPLAVRDRRRRGWRC